MADPAADSYWAPPPAQPQVADDGSALFLKFDPEETVSSQQQLRVLQRPGSGKWKLAKKFPAGFSSSASDQFLVTRPDADGNVLISNYNSHSSSNAYVHLAKGQNPATTVPKPMPGSTRLLDMNRNGDAAVVVPGPSNTLVVHRRPTGPDSDFELVGTLNKMGAQRAYGIGLTVDPDGGIFVVYRTEQELSLLQAYAPPGQGFGTPQVIPDIEHKNDVESPSLKYAQSTNGRVALVWENHRSVHAFGAAPERIMLATRAAGGLLGTPQVIDELDIYGPQWAESSYVAVTDNGDVYIAHSRMQVTTTCEPSSRGRDIFNYLSRVRGTSKTTLDLPHGKQAWKDSTKVVGLKAAGNHLVVLTQRTKISGDRCASSQPKTYDLFAQRTLGGTPNLLLGSVGTSASGSDLGIEGIGLSPTGLAIALVNYRVEKTGGGTERFYRVFSDPSINPAPKAKPKAGSAKVSKSQKLKKSKIAVKPKCGKASGTCKVKVTVKVKSGKKYKKAGSTSKNVKAKKSTSLKVKLSKKTVKQLKKAAKAKKKSKRKVPAKVTVTITKKGAKTYKKTFKIKVRA